MKDHIMVIVKRPAERAYWTVVKNELSALQRLVGGHLEVIRLQRCLALVDEEGKLKGLKPNMVFGMDAIVGTIVFVGEDGEEFTDCPAKWSEILRDMDDLWLSGDV